MRIPLLTTDRVPSAKREKGGLLRVGENAPYFGEQFKMLRAKFEHLTDILHCNVVAVTSSIAGEGKTLFCANLARQLASTGRKNVLMVDTDIRKEDLSRGLGVKKIPGLTEYLLGVSQLEEIIRPSEIPSLSVVPSGTEVPSPADLLAGVEFDEFLRQVRGRFDIVLLDTPPVLPVADTITIRGKVDGFVFLFRAGFTPHPLFRAAVEEIGQKKVLGVVINGVELESPKYYQKYYGSYYTKKEPA